MVCVCVCEWQVLGLILVGAGIFCFHVLDFVIYSFYLVSHSTFLLFGFRLAVCEKALAEYLETKRLAFPRFYFISSTDLLDILSKGNQPSQVRCSLFILSYWIFPACGLWKISDHVQVYLQAFNSTLVSLSLHLKERCSKFSFPFV